MSWVVVVTPLKGYTSPPKMLDWYRKEATNAYADRTGANLTFTDLDAAQASARAGGGGSFAKSGPSRATQNRMKNYAS